MTEPSKAAIERACEWMECDFDNRDNHPGGQNWYYVRRVALRIQEVSDVAKVADHRLWDMGLDEGSVTRQALNALILPDPEPDVLEQALDAAFGGISLPMRGDVLRTELAQRGYAITKVQL